MSFRTEQESFWAGNFGDDYINRNQGAGLLASNLNFFSKSLRNAHGIQSCIEFGANIGMNLKAIQLLYPEIDSHALEINSTAVSQLEEVIPVSNISNISILDFSPSRTWDLTLIKGVLIHIDPRVLPIVYDKLYAACGRYLLLAEYYNPVPVSIPYRGHSNRLFKRDFAGEIMERYPLLELVDYGFVYRRDPNFPQDDINWFLFKKSL